MQRRHIHRRHSRFFVAQRRLNAANALVLAVARTAQVFAKLPVVLFRTHAALSVVDEFARTMIARQVAVLGRFRADLALKGDLER